MMLISIGAALFTIMSYEMASDVGGDHTRIAAQIIPGIGFIGAGVVLRERGAVTGIQRCDDFHDCECWHDRRAGFPVTAVFTTLLLLVSLVFLGLIEDRIGLHTRMLTFTMTTPQGDPSILEHVHQIVQEAGIQAVRWKTHKSQTGPAIIEFDAEVGTPKERELLNRLSALNVHCEARPVAP